MGHAPSMKTVAPLLFLIAVAILSVVVSRANADTVYLNEAQTMAATRACAFDGIHAQVVTTSGTSAATTNATGKGTVRVLCTQAAHMYQGAAGVTGPTAGTGDTFIGAQSPEYFYSPGSKFAFVQDATAGTCYVSDCH